MPRKRRDNDYKAREHLQIVGRDNQNILGKDGKCNHLKKDGKTRCTLKAGQGTDHVGYGACVAHGGNAPSMKKHAARQHASRLSAELDMDPFEALALTIRLSAGAVAFYRGKMDEAQDALEQDDLHPGDRMSYAKAFEAMAQLYGEERDRLSRHSKVAIDAGIDARRLELEVEQATLFAGAIQAILGELQLNAHQRRQAPALVRKHLQAIDAQIVKGA